MTVHRYIYPMKILSIDLTDAERHIKTELGHGVVVTFAVPLIEGAEVKGMKLVLEVSDDAKS